GKVVVYRDFTAPQTIKEQDYIHQLSMKDFLNLREVGKNKDYDEQLRIRLVEYTKLEQKLERVRNLIADAHNLREDCQTLARFFNDITELKNVQKDLINFNNRTEFEKNKQELLNKTNQILSGLTIKTGANTSIGGVCIIWDDFAEFMDSIVSDFRKEIESLKRDIEGTQYEEAQELALLEQKEGELKQEIEENERKAANEPDPEKKKKFIFLADEAKTSLGDNFNPDKHINDFLKSIRDSLSGGNTPSKNPFKPNEPNPTDNSGGNSRPKTPFNPFKPNSNQNTSPD
ncbi:8775_t:CDS:2, partial [Ambispora gerdemannii]